MSPARVEYRVDTSLGLKATQKVAFSPNGKYLKPQHLGRILWNQISRSRRIQDEGILYDLALLPWWVSVYLSIIVYIGIKFGGPAMFANQGMLQGIGDGISKMAGIVAIVFLIPASISFLNCLRKRKLLNRQDGIESIRALPWKEFEELLVEAYRHQGYSVRENSSLGPDGGVDTHGLTPVALEIRTRNLTGA